MHKIHLTHRDKNMEIIGTETVDFSLYCEKLSQMTVRILNDIETLLIENDIPLNNSSYLKIRHKLFDLGGSVKRIPKDLDGGDDD